MVLQDFQAAGLFFFFLTYHPLVTSFETKKYGFLWGPQGYECMIQQYLSKEDSPEFLQFISFQE